MKIIVVGNSAGSILGFRLPLIMDFLNDGHSVTVVSNNFNGDDISFLNSINVTPISYDLEASGINPFKELRTIVQLYKLFKKFKPDIIFSYFTKPVIYSSIGAKLAGVKLIIGMIEGLGITYTISPEGIQLKQKIIIGIQSVFYYISSFCIDKLIVLNRDDEFFFKRWFRFKSIINIGGIGVDLEKYKFTQLKTTPFNFLFIGRLFREKGILNFLNAAEKIKKHYPKVTFTVLGSIDEKNLNSISKEFLEQYVDNSVIIFPGHVANVIEYIIDATVFVLPSYYREGLPRSTQEALAIGRPVITTSIAGCAETVINNVNGKIVDLYDYNSLYEAMEYMIINKDILPQMGKVSRKIAEEKYDIKKINLKILSILNLNINKE